MANCSRHTVATSGPWDVGLAPGSGLALLHALSLSSEPLYLYRHIIYTVLRRTVGLVMFSALRMQASLARLVKAHLRNETKPLQALKWHRWNVPVPLPDPGTEGYSA